MFCCCNQSDGRAIEQGLAPIASQPLTPHQRLVMNRLHAASSGMAGYLLERFHSRVSFDAGTNRLRGNVHVGVDPADECAGAFGSPIQEALRDARLVDCDQNASKPGVTTPSSLPYGARICSPGRQVRDAFAHARSAHRQANASA
jgi:hypothetical protein